MTTDDWSRYEKLVLSKIGSLDEGHKLLHHDLEILRLEQAKMQIRMDVRASLVGAIAGAIPAAAVALYVILGA